jgi:hypothetical protein
MKKSFLIVLSALLIFSFEALSQKKAKTTNKSATAGKATTKIYESKSGKLVYKMDFMGEQFYTLYWDDYGAKEAKISKVDVEILGQKSSSENVVIKMNGYTYNYDLEKKTGTKSKTYTSLGGAQGVPSDISKMAKDEMEKMKLVDLGTKEILGKTCKGMQLEPMGMKMEIWTWGKLMIASKTWLSKTGDPMVMDAVSLELDITIPPEIFKIPDDIVFTER